MKVGDYVRTKGGLIAKYIGIEKECELHLFDSNIQWFYEYYREEIDFEEWEEFIKEEVVKSSPNILDLIEVGDYVNGLKVSGVGESYHGRKDKAIYCDYCEDKETGKWTMIYDDEIKSIVTKEQFESMEYKI